MSLSHIEYIEFHRRRKQSFSRLRYRLFSDRYRGWSRISRSRIFSLNRSRLRLWHPANICFDILNALSAAHTPYRYWIRLTEFVSKLEELVCLVRASGSKRQVIHGVVRQCETFVEKGFSGTASMLEKSKARSRSYDSTISLEKIVAHGVWWN